MLEPAGAVVLEPAAGAVVLEPAGAVVLEPAAGADALEPIVDDMLEFSAVVTGAAGAVVCASGVAAGWLLFSATC